MVNQEVARADRQEQRVSIAVDCFQPTGQPHIAMVRPSRRRQAIGVRQQRIEAVEQFAVSRLNPLSENGFDQDLLLRRTERHNHIVVNVQTQGVETEEQRDPAQVRDDRFFVLEHAIEHVVLVLGGIVITHQEDCAVGKRTHHQEASNVLVVSKQGSLGREVLRNEGIRRHGIHVLSHQRGHNTQRSQGQSQLEVQRVVQRIKQTLVSVAQLARRRLVRFQDFLDAVTNTKVGTVHVTGDDEDHRDRQVVVSNIRQPQGFRLGVETAQEGQDCGASPLSRAKHMTSRIGVLGIHAPVTGEERSQTSRVRSHRQEVIPTHMHATRFGNCHVHQVTRPSQRRHAEQTRQVVVQTRFCVLEPGEAGAELGLQVQPAGKQHQSRQHQQEHSALVQVAHSAHPDRVPPVVNARERNVHGARSTALGERINGSLAKVRIPNCVGDRTDVQGIFHPLLKVALPGHMEQVARSPQEDDCQVTEVRRENLLIKIFFRHAIVAFKVVGCGNPVPDPPRRGISGEILAKFWEFGCHKSCFCLNPRCRSRVSTSDAIRG